MEFSIRALIKSDIPKVVIIVKQTIPGNAWKDAKVDVTRNFSKSLKEHYRRQKYWVYMIEGKIVGFIGIFALNYYPRHVSWLDWFSVDKSYQRRGIGSALLNHAIEYLKKVGVKLLIAETYQPNGESAKRFYKKNGFKKAGFIKKYWDKTHDWVLMIKRIG